MEKARESVFHKSESIPQDALKVQGYDFNQGIDYSKIMNSYLTTGYQATHFGQSINIIKKMIEWRLSNEPMDDQESKEYTDPLVRENTKCKIFLGYTSNLVSSGLREVIRYLAQHQKIHVICTSAGGIEEDFVI
jgi:deoxyhypusine synthase